MIFRQQHHTSLSRQRASALLGLLLVVCCHPLFSQTPADSALALARNKSLHDSVRAKALVRASQLFIADLDSKAIHIHYEALRFSDSIAYLEGKAKVLYNLLYFYQHIHIDLDSAVFYGEQALVLNKQVKNYNTYGTVGVHLGLIYQKQRRFAKSLEYFLEASRVLEVEGNYRNSGLGFEVLADVYVLKGEYEQAHRYYQKAIERYRHNKRYRLLMGVYLSRAEAYLKQNLLKEAAACFQSFDSTNLIDDGRNNVFVRLQYLSTRARWFHEQGRCDLSLQLLDSATLVSKHTGIALEMDYYLDKAGCYFHTNQFVKAGEVLQLGLRLPDNLKLSEEQRDALKLQAELLEATGKSEEALQAYKAYMQLADSLHTSFSMLNISDLEKAVESERIKRESEILQSKLEMEHQKVLAQRQWIIFICVFILMAIVMILFLMRSRSQIRKKNRLLNEQNKEIQAQNEEIVAQNEEIVSQTEQLKYKNEFLEQQKIHLEEINQEKDGLMSIVAHDLRAPINRTKGLATLLQTRLRGADETELLEKILQVSDESIRLIKDILDVNSIQYEESQPAFEVIHVKSFVQDEVIRPLFDQANHKGIRIQSVLNDQVQLITEGSSLKRILENLLSNAIKFSPKHSIVIVRAEQIQDEVFFSVKDQGPGISVADQKKMFKKFQRLTARPTGGEQSTGLGLSIVKSLVEKLSGEIMVKSKLNEGTEFVLKLPRRYMVPFSKMVC